MRNPEGLMQVGAVLCGLGGSLAIGYFIYTQEQDVDFWSWPGMLGLAITLIGIVALIIGLRDSRPTDRTQVNQHQKGGKLSTNHQAGRDIVINRKNDDD
jgi:hypothetical protein